MLHRGAFECRSHRPGAHGRSLLTRVLRPGLLALTACASAAAGAQGTGTVDPDHWTFALSPYVWLPTINAHLDLRYAGSSPGLGSNLPGTIHAEIGPNSYLTKLNFALMLNGQARRGPWSVTGDFIGVWASGLGGGVRGFTPSGGRLGDIPVSADLDRGTDTKLSATIWTVTAGYNLVESAQWRVDSIAGFRYADLSATTDWHLAGDLTTPSGTLALSRSGSITVTRQPLDAIVGVQGRYTINSNWYVPYHLDIGGGSTKLDWEFLGGVAYGFSWGEVTLAYRYLDIEQHSGQAFKKETLGGPLLGATFHF